MLTALCWWLGGPDDLGRAGRALSAGTSTQRSTVTPWPGSFYTWPVLLLLGLVLAVTWWALRLIADRPRAGVDVTSLAADDTLRRAAAGRLAAGIAVGAYGTAAGIALGAAAALANLRDGDWLVGVPLEGAALTSPATVLGILAALAGVVATALFVVPSARRAAPAASPTATVQV